MQVVDDMVMAAKEHDDGKLVAKIHWVTGRHKSRGIASRKAYEVIS
jgi:hypothetical protein